MRSKIEARLDALTAKKMEQEAKWALQNENNLQTSDIPNNSLAVLYFKNLSNSQELTPLQKGLTDMMITDLSQIQRLNVVERVKMQKLLEEMGLGYTGLIDEKTAPRFGKLIGANRLINGSFLDLNSEKIQLQAGMIGVKKREFTQGDKIDGDLDKIFQYIKNYGFEN